MSTFDGVTNSLLQLSDCIVVLTDYMATLLPIWWSFIGYAVVLCPTTGVKCGRGPHWLAPSNLSGDIRHNGSCARQGLPLLMT